jgi:hypothetical protein
MNTTHSATSMGMDRFLSAKNIMHGNLLLIESRDTEFPGGFFMDTTKMSHSNHFPVFLQSAIQYLRVLLLDLPLALPLPPLAENKHR